MRKRKRQVVKKLIQCAAIRINSDGKDGKDIDVEAIGYLEGYQEHKEESGAGE